MTGESPPRSGDGFEEVYRADDGEFRVFSANLPAPGGVGTHVHHRVTIGKGRRGVVIVCRYGDDVLLARSRRAAAGRTLEEFCRGLLEDDDESTPEPYAAAAARELREETGVAAQSIRVIGEILVDSAVYPLRVGVAVVDAGSREPTSTPDGEVDHVSWVTARELDRMISVGEIVDAITLSAWAVARSLGPR